MPQWMVDALTELQNAFPEGTSIRCRSSTNNEDLPDFSGAGLYTSRTQHPEEGHIAKSIKQVYAGLWNFRAFDARQFYRIDHFTAAMGVLVHPNFSNERANGVGVTTDPIYQTEETYYLNTQLGEDLVTNPEALSIPEEIVLSSRKQGGYTLVRPSNQVPDGERLLSEEHLSTLRSHLQTIHKEFRVLYDAEDVDDFAMEIEYKITDRGRVAIKQARPWVR
jgi:phosphoenolpyruvate synthase/pyruvate phosphate dikinase